MLLKIHGIFVSLSLTSMAPDCLLCSRILSATVRENILFSHEYDEQFYNLVINGTLLCRSITSSLLTQWPRLSLRSGTRFSFASSRGFDRSW